jgi:hypothetical protein
LNSKSWRDVVFLAALACAISGAAAAAGQGSEGLAGSEGTTGPKPGWLRMPRSLLYYDAEGSLTNEIGLGRWEESSQSRVKVKVIDGGTSPDHRFAWTLDKRTTWNSLKTQVLESQRSLRFFDPDGKELWNEDGADSLTGSAPLVFSEDGKTCLLALRRPAGWYALLKTYLGNTLWEVGPFPRLEALQISPNGRYGLARWDDPDKSAVHSFLDLQGRNRQDVSSDHFLLGKTAVDDQGRAFAGPALVFSFTGPAVSTATAAPAASEVPQAPAGRTSLPPATAVSTAAAPGPSAKP